MEGISIGDWITIFFRSLHHIVGDDVFALIRNHVMLQECIKKIETLFSLINQMKDRGQVRLLKGKYASKHFLWTELQCRCGKPTTRTALVPAAMYSRGSC